MKMHISQKDLLWGVEKDFVRSFMDIAEKVSCETGDFLFRQGDKAEHFYFLIKGRISLSIGEMGQLVYIINKEGETFGWSSIAGRGLYSSSAECLEQTSLYKINKERLDKLLDSDPKNGMIFCKKVLENLGDRLVQSYHNLMIFSSYFHY
ncbi:MAG: cyclic nucleotide-binding domain-containing protein [Desulfobacterales bacterium]|nr:cyclic nucleotide-binding domain-containing protein [Desulfobacterales bacterium]